MADVTPPDSAPVAARRDAAAGARGAAPLLEVVELRKSFGETRALASCSFSAPAGAVHAILGENGSGKSTLVKILSGVLAPDGGEIRLGGTAITRFDPRAARAAGIAPVLQEVLVAPNRSVVENVFLGHDPLFRRTVGLSERRRLARDALAAITRTRFDLDALVEELPLPQRQLVTIARAVVRRPRLLILDESTSALDVGDREVLFDAIREFVAGGGLVIYISHRLDEVIELCDSVTVLRSGASVATRLRGDYDVHTLLRLMSPAAAATIGEDADV